MVEPSWHLAAAAVLLLCAAPYPGAPAISQWTRDSEEVRCPTFVEQNHCDCQVSELADDDEGHLSKGRKPKQGKFFT